MKNADPNGKVRNLIDNLTDTQSWATLASELEKFIPKVDENTPRATDETIDLRDLLSSVGEQEDEQDQLLSQK